MQNNGIRVIKSNTIYHVEIADASVPWELRVRFEMEVKRKSREISIGHAVAPGILVDLGVGAFEGTRIKFARSKLLHEREGEPKQMDEGDSPKLGVAW